MLHVQEGDVWISSLHEESITLAKRATESGVQCIVAVGGDGTVHQVANGIMIASPSSSAEDRPILAVFPLGSGNDFARHLKQRATPRRFAEALQACKTTNIDLLGITFLDHHAHRCRRFCINVADVGLGGYVSRLAQQRFQFLRPTIRYALAVMIGMLRFRRTALTVSIDRTSVQATCMSVCMANGSYFGSGMAIAPKACLDDGIAEMTIVGDVGLIDYLLQLPSLRAARPLRHKQIFYHQASTCSVESERQLDLEIDGECLGTTPIHMQVLPHQLRILLV